MSFLIKIPEALAKPQSLDFLLLAKMGTLYLVLSIEDIHTSITVELNVRELVRCFSRLGNSLAPRKEHVNVQG